MMMGIPMKNRKTKIEKPRPLKICTLGDQSMESVLSEMDLVAQYLNSSTCDRTVYPAIVALCENLKMFGPQLENVYKDQLDKCYISLRNGCRDDRLSLAARYRLLEVIELRAMHWQPNENLINYYKQKLVQIEAEEAALEDQQNDSLSQTIPSTIMTPTSTPQMMIPSLQQYQQTMYNQQQSPIPHPPTPTLLGPGEIIRSSGKFAKPTRIPGKNYCKDEVVIRNADSGKVMGIKGRRVHMIEELSETIISFQRVAPGARERLVQITGPAEENINQAKHLIEETIRRNASPVRGDERGSIFTTLGGSSSSISSHTSDETLQVLRKYLSLDEISLSSRRSGSKRNTLVHSQSMGDDPLGEYRYTVTHGSDVLRITGNNLHLVRTAKLVLDEFFSGERNLNNIALLLGTDASSEPVADSTTTTSQGRQPSPTVQTPTTDLDLTGESFKGGVVTVVRQPLFPSSSKEAIESAESSSQPGDQSSKNRRALFQKTSEDRANGDDAGPSTPGTTSPMLEAVVDPLPAVPARRCYTRAFLVQCASSPLSRLTPDNWSQVVKQTPIVFKKNWQYLSGVVATLNEQGEAAVNSVPSYLQASDLEDAAVLAKRELRWTLVRTMSTTEEDDNGNNAT
ncbi:eukaryotic translation initiation factor 4E-binding protein Mextli isoform X1 [Cherax quadricarinatus]|uniref:eukaryotic translation initiation factor 4E-binding protein Mextli isoform X1 n=2 Tax=Cherax quadricarinatus TaxID=27406 RepID=UPI002379B1D7|nr:eukaryotic translation initiation factor 4E-binding protein Mextli-like isoform X1 [Cherax quadricarinatus]